MSADPLPMIAILQEGIRQALLDEAMQWTGDARVEVWMALIDAGQRMGIVITKDELYRMQAERQQPDPVQAPPAESDRRLWNGQRPAYGITPASLTPAALQTPAADETPPTCPRCHNNRQVWRNQISGLWKCHRAYCDTVIEDPT